MRTDKLHSILRTTKNNIRYIMMQIPDDCIKSMNNNLYVRGYMVSSLISKYLEENGVGTKGIYLEASKQYYDSINLSDKARLIRLEYDNAVKTQQKI